MAKNILFQTSVNHANEYHSDKEMWDSRSWIDRVNGTPVKRRMWRMRAAHTFPEAEGLTLDPLPPIWVQGARPRKKKRGRKRKSELKV